MEKIIEFAKQYKQLVMEKDKENIGVLMLDIINDIPHVQVQVNNTIIDEYESMNAVSEADAKKRKHFVGIKEIDGVYFTQVIYDDDPRFPAVMQSAIKKYKEEE